MEVGVNKADQFGCRAAVENGNQKEGKDVKTCGGPCGIMED